MLKNPVLDVYDINSFCQAHSISRGLFYRLLREGKGPRIAKVGKRTLITREAAEQWRAALDNKGGRHE